MFCVVEYQDTDIFSPDERLQRAIGPFQSFEAANAEAERLGEIEEGEPSDIPLVYSVLAFEAPEVQA